MAKDGNDAKEPGDGKSRRTTFEASTLLETSQSLVSAADPASQNCC